MDNLYLTYKLLSSIISIYLIIHMPKSQKYIYLSLGLSPKQNSQLSEMAEYLGMSRSNIMRVALTEKFEDMSKKRFGYKGYEATPARIQEKAKKQAQQAEQGSLIEQMREMSDWDLTMYLHDIGYLTSGAEVSSGTTKEFVITRDIAGNRILEERHISGDLGPESPTYRRSVFTWDEMISDMKKEGKL